jgi:activating signal cointegrator 1
MRAISLYQPWASFVAAGIKPFETRSWSPPAALIGQRIAIHAAKKKTPRVDSKWALRCGVDSLPLGAVVCTAILAGAYRCYSGPEGGRHVWSIERLSGSPHEYLPLVTPAAITTDEYGDYAWGRWAWLLTNIERLDPPIPAQGTQRFWEWHP